MPYQGGIQLLPETPRRASLASYTEGNAYFWVGVSLGILVIVTGAILGGYASSRVDAINKIDGQMELQEKTRDRARENVLIDAYQQSIVIKQLLADKLYWSKALESMQRMLQMSVKLTDLSADAKTSMIRFSATADSYAAVAQQIAAFSGGTGIKDITVKSVAATSNGGVSFDGSLLIDSAVLLQQSSTP